MESRKRMTSPIIAVVGLGYVGLPLAVEFGKKHRTLGFDLESAKSPPTSATFDPTDEVCARSSRPRPSSSRARPMPRDLADADFIIVAVPTPVDAAHNPDFWPLVSSSTTVGRHLKRGAIVVYESTVYPGATEEICVPVLEKRVGPEMEAGLLRRLLARAHQPGRQRAHADQDHQGRLRRHAETLERVQQLYGSIIEAGRLSDDAASRSPRRRRSSRTRSATSTSR